MSVRTGPSELRQSKIINSLYDICSQSDPKLFFLPFFDEGSVFPETFDERPVWHALGACTVSFALDEDPFEIGVVCFCLNCVSVQFVVEPGALCRLNDIGLIVQNVNNVPTVALFYVIYKAACMHLCNTFVFLYKDELAFAFKDEVPSATDSFHLSGVRPIDRPEVS